jgi:hypothetical protein
MGFITPIKTKVLDASNVTSSSKKIYNWVTKSKAKLPPDFHQKIIELENKFIKTKTLPIIEELLLLYKV